MLWLLLLTTSATVAQAQFCEVNGMFVFEVESLDYSGTDWVLRSDVEPYTGSGYLVWDGPDDFTSVSGEISATVMIGTIGTYVLQWRSLISKGAVSSESNDSWLKVSGAGSVFFAEQNGGSIIYPRGGCPTNSCAYPNGNSVDGFFKVFQNQLGRFDWKTHTSDSDDHKILVTISEPGTYTIEIGGRSNGHGIDRLVGRLLPEYGSVDLEDFIDDLEDKIHDLDHVEHRCDETFAPTLVPDIGILGVVLINAETNEDIAVIQEDGIVYYDEGSFDPTSSNIRALTDGTLGSIVMEIPGVKRKTESKEPYALFGDNSNLYDLSYNSGVLDSGVWYDLTCTPYSESSGKGVAGRPYELRFMLMPGFPPDPTMAPTPEPVGITSLILVDSTTGSDILTITDGDIDVPEDFDPDAVSVRAETIGTTLESVSFVLDNSAILESHTYIDDTAPYYLFGDDDDDYGAIVPGTLDIGPTYTLAVTPSKGDPVVFSFNLRRTGTAAPTPKVTTVCGGSENFEPLPVTNLTHWGPTDDNYAVTDDGCSVELDGTTWKAFELTLPWIVEETSVLYFCYERTVNCRVHAISVTNDRSVTTGGPIFMVDGTNGGWTAPVRDFQYNATLGGSQCFSISLSNYLGETDVINYIAFINSCPTSGYPVTWSTVWLRDYN